MNLARKTFKDNKTGQVIKVIDSFENIAILENKEKIDTRRLLDPNLYTEQINPSEFFESTSSAFDSIFDKIRKMPTDNIPDDKGDIKPNFDDRFKPAEEDSAVIYSSIDEEREELARKYGLGINTKDSLVKQNESFAKLIGEDMVNELPLPSLPDVEEPVQRIEIDRDEDWGRNVKQREEKREEKKEDPIINMFRGVKRSVEFSLDLKLENKIPRLDFIEMMEDSYEKSIIDFLATEFTNELLKDPKNLKERISEKIREMVYKKKAVVKKPKRKPTIKKNSRLDKTPLSKLEQDAKIIKRGIKKETEKHD